jgi:hypothetical protein
MKTNIFQKATLLLFIACLIIFSIWFVPFREVKSWDNGYERKHKKVIIYDSIISDHQNIDLYRTSILFTLIILTFGTILFLTSKIPNPDFNNPQTKKVIKREFIYSCIVVSMMVGTNFYCIIKNYNYTSAEKKHQSLIDQITKIENSNVEFVQKHTQRGILFNLIDNTFDLKNDTTPDMLYNSFNKENNIASTKDIFNRIDINFKNQNNIKSEEDLRNFIKGLQYTKYELWVLEKLRNLVDQIIESEEYIKENHYLYRNDFIRLIIQNGVLSFIILFVFRVFYLKARIFFNYIQSA